MKVIFIREARSRGYIRVGISDGEEKYDLTVSESDYREAGSPLCKDDVDRDTLLLLLDSDMRYRAGLYALRILSYADNNEKTLLRKLISRGIRADIAALVARDMVSRGYINEKRQLSLIITEEVNRKLTGPHKLRPKLISKGYSAADIDSEITMLLSSNEIDFERSKHLLIEKKLPTDATEEEIKKLLYKNGYDIC